jgi:hypothetical protein
MGRDERPQIPPWRRRATAADFYPAEAAAEQRRLEAEQGRTVTSSVRERQPESEDELEELGVGERQRIRNVLRSDRGG